MGIPWVEKYRPRTLKDIVGNTQAIREMLQWAEEWEKGTPKYKALILVGKPGCGKTSAARALAMDMGWGVIELNASDVRNEANIKKIAMVGAVMDTFTDDGRFLSAKKGGKKLIIFDEADNLYEGTKEGGDRGGKKAIVETIKITKQPIILIGNDYYSIVSGTWGRALRSLAKVIKFRALTRPQIVKVLRRICEIENIKCDEKALLSIAAKSGGDLRAAINDLQAIAEGKKYLKIEDVFAAGWRDTRNEIYKTTLTILHTVDYKTAKSSLMNLDEDPNFVMLWLEENMPLEYTKPEDLARGYEYLSKADVLLGRVWRRQQYSLWSYAMDMMAAISVAKDEKYKKHPKKYNFPSWLMEMSKSRKTRQVRDSIGIKVGKIYHTSYKRTLEDVIPYFRVIYDKNEHLRSLYTYLLHLTTEEISQLTDEDPEKVKKDAEKVGKEIEKRGEGGSA